MLHENHGWSKDLKMGTHKANEERSWHYAVLRKCRWRFKAIHGGDCSDPGVTAINPGGCKLVAQGPNLGGLLD